MKKARKLDSRNKKSEIIDTLRVFVRYLRFWGVFPYKVKDFELVYTKFGVFLLIVNGIGLAIGVLSSFLADFGNQIVGLVEAIQYPTLSLVSLLMFNVKFRSLNELAGKLLGFGHEIDLDVKDLKKKLVKLMILVALVSLVFLPVTHIVTIYARCLILGPNFWDRVLDWNFIFFAWAANNFFLVQTVFVGLMLYLKECFVNINQKFITIDLENGISKIFHDSEVSINLRRLIKLRQRLVDTAEEANRLFYPELIVWCWAILFEILYSCFYIISFVLEKHETDPETKILVSYLPFWFGFQFFAVTYICYASDGITVEANKTGDDVHRLILNCSSKVISRRLYEYSFGLYIYKLRITAMGFFNVDLGLCQGIIAGLCTYLVILLQFRFTPSNNKTIG